MNRHLLCFPGYFNGSSKIEPDGKMLDSAITTTALFLLLVLFLLSRLIKYHQQLQVRSAGTYREFMISNDKFYRRP